MHNNESKLTVSRTLIFTQSAGGPISTTLVTTLPNENQVPFILSEKLQHIQMNYAWMVLYFFLFPFLVGDVQGADS